MSRGATWRRIWMLFEYFQVKAHGPISLKIYCIWTSKKCCVIIILAFFQLSFFSFSSTSPCTCTHQWKRRMWLRDRGHLVLLCDRLECELQVHPLHLLSPLSRPDWQGLSGSSCHFHRSPHRHQVPWITRWFAYPFHVPPLTVWRNNKKRRY